jgi:hypothetical protein
MNDTGMDGACNNCDKLHSKRLLEILAACLECSLI